jgi:hypothetical protein
MRPGAIDVYRRQIERELQARSATEHTHRPALKTLIESLASGVTATNEPKRAECGVPDFALTEKREPLWGSGGTYRITPMQRATRTLVFPESAFPSNSRSLICQQPYAIDRRSEIFARFPARTPSLVARGRPIPGQGEIPR